jgi:hypothetical protein
MGGAEPSAAGSETRSPITVPVPGNDVIDPVGGRLGHAPGATTRAEATEPHPT